MKIDMAMWHGRFVWIDCLKLFAIFLVVWGHVGYNFFSDQSLDSFSIPIRLYIYAFHMPLFMTISGYLSSRMLDNGGDLMKKFKTLIVPCITLFSIFMLFGITTQNMWYLKSLFLCYWIIYMYVKFCLIGGGKNIICLLVISLFFFCLFPVISKIPYLSAYKVDFMLPFFMLGILLNRKMKPLIGNIRYLAIWLLLFLVSMFLWKSDYIWYNSRSAWFPLKQMLYSRSIMFDINNLKNVTIRFVVGGVSSLFFMSLFYYLSQTCFFERIFEKIGKYGKYTLHVYIFQTFFVELNLFGIYLPSGNMNLFQFVYSPLVALAITILCIGLAIVLEKNKYVNRYLFGNF